MRDRANLRSDDALASVLGVSRPTVSRTLNGQTEPSTKFVAHALHAFPFASFDRLFTLAPSTR